MLAPCIVTLDDPVTARFARFTTLIILRSTDIELVRDPIWAPVVNMIFMVAVTWCAA